MRLVNFIIRRLAFAFITLLVLGFVIFYTTIFFPPVERALIFVSPFAYSHPGFDIYSRLPDIARRYHLDDPFYVQYAVWLKGVFTEGTLGYSFYYNEWVTVIIAKKFPATLEIVLYSAPIIIFGGIKLGAYSARRAHERKGREDPIDFIIRVVTTGTYSVPSFFSALLLILIFCSSLHWVGLGRVGMNADMFIHSRKWIPYTGLYTIDALLNGQLWVFTDALSHLVLPVITVTLSMLPIIARITRQSMLGELSNQYVIMAKAKGLRKGEVLSHARRNSMISILTISSIILASLLTGLIVTEYTFNIGGLGFSVVRAAQKYDFPLLVGLAVFFCFIFAIVNFAVDIIYTYIDPRVRL